MSKNNEWKSEDVFRFQEYVASDGSMRVDRESKVIRGVRVLGSTSKNNRVYTQKAMENAIGLYENRPINIDHSTESTPRTVRDRFGWMSNVRYSNDGLVADLHYLGSHPVTESILEAAERNPALFGLSHDADGRIERKGNCNVVEEIIGVRSVDVVADPATTKSLFESMSVQESPGMDEKGEEEKDVSAEVVDNEKQGTAVLEAALDGIKQEVAQLKESLKALTELKDAIAELKEQVKAPIHRPKSVPLVEGSSEKAPTTTEEFVKALTGNRK